MTDATTPEAVAALVYTMEAEHVRNGGQGAYAWTARELCGKGAATLTTLMARVEELEEVVPWRWGKHRERSGLVKVYAKDEMDAYMQVMKRMNGG